MAEIHKQQLYDLGFIEVKKDLFLKQIDNITTLYRDYRQARPVSYAYHRDKRVDAYTFKETKAIEKIEETLKELNGVLE